MSSWSWASKYPPSLKSATLTCVSGGTSPFLTKTLVAGEIFCRGRKRSFHHLQKMPPWIVGSQNRHWKILSCMPSFRWCRAHDWFWKHVRDSKVLPLAAWYKEIDHAVHLEGQHSHGVLLPYLQVQFHHGPLQQPTATAESTTSEASDNVFAGQRRLWALPFLLRKMRRLNSQMNFGQPTRSHAKLSPNIKTTAKKKRLAGTWNRSILSGQSVICLDFMLLILLVWLCNWGIDYLSH